MKRTQHIHHAGFRKRWRLSRAAPVALAVGAVFALAGCEKSDENVTLYQNSDDCSRANPSMAEQCATAYRNAQQEAEKTAPKYRSRADCVADFGEDQCTRAPAQAGMAAESSSGSFWMPLMAGYMMGRLMNGGYAQQPLFTSRAPGSPANGKFVDASGRGYGPVASGRSMAVPKSAMAPKPATTTTITRGGFGETVAKQSAAMQRSTGTMPRAGSGG
ncbi:DUF1190 family protein [Martelella alba]|uniref:DUF1190 family protein n=1 Tax=Martelella alba TaxID=2590451 RepID=A0ABY2SI92_9HYPH|nr:DUF1190 family protein [Martelella alba]TKI04900.1 DUF1190 family protein [Martelella alba]